MSQVELDPAGVDAAAVELSLWDKFKRDTTHAGARAIVRAYFDHASTAATTKLRWERWRLYQDPEKCPWLLIAGRHPAGEPLVDCNSVAVIASLDRIAVGRKAVGRKAEWILKLGMHNRGGWFETAESAAAWASEELGQDLPLPGAKP